MPPSCFQSLCKLQTIFRYACPDFLCHYFMKPLQNVVLFWLGLWVPLLLLLDIEIKAATNLGVVFISNIFGWKVAFCLLEWLMDWASLGSFQYFFIICVQKSRKLLGGSPLSLEWRYFLRTFNSLLEEVEYKFKELREYSILFFWNKQ